ncbi:MAG: ABC transporter substrate-binding protein, partial [Clostridia bacterium]|nr:ABC transporter substrate-binding protein [Clostridia bacterium]
QNGLDPQSDVKIKYKADASELSAVWNTEKDAIIVAPSPASAAITVQYPQAKKVLDFTEEWQKCSPDSRLMMGCVVARTEFCQKNPELINDFLAEYKASVSTAGENPEATGKICEQYGIVAKATLVVKGLDDCHLCFITGDEMENGLTGYLKVLYESDPATVGKLPDKEFWYKGF